MLTNIKIEKGEKEQPKRTEMDKWAKLHIPKKEKKMKRKDRCIQRFSIQVGEQNEENKRITGNK